VAIWSFEVCFFRYSKIFSNYQNDKLNRFRYKLDSDGFHRLQTLRYESVELIQQLNNDVNKIEINNLDTNNRVGLFEFSSTTPDNLSNLQLIQSEQININSTLMDENSKETLQRNNSNSISRIEFDFENFLNSNFQQNKMNSQQYSSNSHSDNSMVCIPGDINLKEYFIE
jgi:hypothetical protein